jgi:hypothetical protein
MRGNTESGDYHNSMKNLHPCELKQRRHHSEQLSAEYVTRGISFRFTSSKNR